MVLRSFPSLTVTPAPFSVIPAEAGTQGPMRHIAGVMAFPGTKILSVALDPRFRGEDRLVEIYSLKK